MDDRPVLHQVNLVVRDMDAAVAFYRRLGVEIADTAPQWDREESEAVEQGLDPDHDGVPTGSHAS